MVHVLLPGQRQADVTSVHVHMCVCVCLCGGERERVKNVKRVDVIRAVGIKLFQFVVQTVGGIVTAEMFVCRSK
jgi:hypothetical protein